VSTTPRIAGLPPQESLLLSVLVIDYQLSLHQSVDPGGGHELLQVGQVRGDVGATLRVEELHSHDVCNARWAASVSTGSPAWPSAERLDGWTATDVGPGVSRLGYSLSDAQVELLQAAQQEGSAAVAGVHRRWSPDGYVVLPPVQPRR
jgi:hypothetical protein